MGTSVFTLVLHTGGGHYCFGPRRKIGPAPWDLRVQPFTSVGILTPASGLRSPYLTELFQHVDQAPLAVQVGARRDGEVSSD